MVSSSDINSSSSDPISSDSVSSASFSRDPVSSDPIDFPDFSDFSDDRILNGRIFIRQPKKGYRVAIDPVLLSYFAIFHESLFQSSSVLSSVSSLQSSPTHLAQSTSTFSAQSIPFTDSKTVLDVGCGVGAISLILKSRNPSLQITSIDIDSGMIDLCKYNSAKNSLDLDIQNVALEKFRSLRKYDYVITNPPFFPKKSSRISQAKLLANFETMELSEWISVCLKHLRDKGTFAIIQSASRLSEILDALKIKTGDIRIIPIYPKADGPAIRVIVTCVKGSRAETKIFPGLILHNNDGSYTDLARKILEGSF